MPVGVSVEVEGGFARITFLDKAKRGPALDALLDTGAPIEVKTGGPLKAYIVPEGNAREAGLLDAPAMAPSKPAPPRPAVSPVTAQTAPSREEAPKKPAEPVEKPPAAKKAVPAKKAPAKKVPESPVAEKKEAEDGGSEAERDE